MKIFIYIYVYKKNKKQNKKYTEFGLLRWQFLKSMRIKKIRAEIFSSTANGGATQWTEDEKKDFNPDKIQVDKTCTTKPTACLQSSTLRHWLQSIYRCFVIGSKWLRLECTVQQISSATAPAPHFSANVEERQGRGGETSIHRLKDSGRFLFCW